MDMRWPNDTNSSVFMSVLHNNMYLLVLIIWIGFHLYHISVEAKIVEDTKNHDSLSQSRPRHVNK